VIKRIALLAIVGLLPVALFLVWPKVRERLTTAELTVRLVRQPREEVLITGFIKSPGAQPFSIQTLTIEEPGKEPYRRLISLDAENTFELTLGKPVTGNYRTSMLLAKAESSASTPDRWLTTPQLTVEAGRSLPIERVAAGDYNRPRLLIVAAACAAIWIVLLALCIRAWMPATRPLERFEEQITSS
jgi:hypothetical protein